MSIAIGLSGQRIVTEWGDVEHPCPRPDRGEVGHLMIATTDYINQLLAEGESPAPNGCGLHSVSTRGGRLFAHHDYNAHRWTWELFDAHFSDGDGPEIYLGRWPD